MKRRGHACGSRAAVQKKTVTTATHIKPVLLSHLDWVWFERNLWSAYSWLTVRAVACVLSLLLQVEQKLWLELIEIPWYCIDRSNLISVRWRKSIYYMVKSQTRKYPIGYLLFIQMWIYTYARSLMFVSDWMIMTTLAWGYQLCFWGEFIVVVIYLMVIGFPQWTTCITTRVIKGSELTFSHPLLLGWSKVITRCTYVTWAFMRPTVFSLLKSVESPNGW